MITYLSQRDPRWAKVLIGDSGLPIGRWGCTITALCMVAGYFGETITPDKVARTKGLFTKDGKIIWGNLNKAFKSFKFVERAYGKQVSKINKSIMGKDLACILEVDNQSHWILALRSTNVAKGYLGVDPITGKVCSALEDFRNITGSAHFVKA